VATANSDDPAYFGGYMNDTLTQVCAATGMNSHHAWQLAAHSFEASFADAGDTSRWRDQLGEVFERFA